jgi:hypothetical protein
MGWASGTTVMRDMITAFNNSIVHHGLPESNIVQFWTAAISALEYEDWDTQTECLGICPIWDKAYFAGHPYDEGYFVQMKGARNPHRKGTDRAKKWQEGYDDWIHEENYDQEGTP